MATFNIPVTSDKPFYTFSAVLLGNTYNFTIKWNGRASQWTISIADNEFNPLISGLAMVSGVDFLTLAEVENLPDGSLIVYNTANELEDPTRDNLGTDCLLLYVEPAEA